MKKHEGNQKKDKKLQPKELAVLLQRWDEFELQHYRKDLKEWKILKKKIKEVKAMQQC